jgi:hypothetical protein
MGIDRFFRLAAVAALLLSFPSSGGTQERQRSHPSISPGAAKEAGRPGKVLETIDSGGYTYVQVDMGSEKIWAAAPQFDVHVGDSVMVPDGLPMTNYQSKTLNRTFDQVYFVPYVAVAGAERSPGASTSDESHVKPAAETPALDFSGLEKPSGGKSVAELFGEKASLGGTEILVRGKVVKYTAGIMGKNWIHLQDGTGDEGTNDVTITTQSSVEVGDTVLVRGTATTNKDFGFGYRYELIIEDATITVE